MRKIFESTKKLDAGVREKYGLSEEIMMENAAAALESRIAPHIFRNRGFYLFRPCVLVIAGPGNNGADGYAVARRLNSHDVSVVVCESGIPKTEMARIQKNRAALGGVQFIGLYELDDFVEEKSFDITVVVDCLFGAGFRLPLDFGDEMIIRTVNKIDAFKIACDIPSGLDSCGNGGVVFRADETVCMGAATFAHYSDYAKDFTGEIFTADLGVARNNYEGNFPCGFLLEQKDAKLPFRKKQNVNKGTFGHVAVACGEKPGAAQIASLAALNFGAGLVTLVGKEDSACPEIMASEQFPARTSAAAVGMGLGRGNAAVCGIMSHVMEEKIPCVLDADIFYRKEICEWLRLISGSGTKCVATPHPKEFSKLLKNCGLGEKSVDEVCRDRIALVKQFCETFPGIVLVLKGANTVIGLNEDGKNMIFVNPHGNCALAKAGSGDVLSGLIAALLSQGYDALDAAVTGSLVHALAAGKIEPNYALTPQKLIDAVACLPQE